MTAFSPSPRGQAASTWTCRSCGSSVETGQYCGACGLRRSTGRSQPGLAALLTDMRNEKSGLLAAAAVFVCALALSYALWVPAGLPARVIDAPIPETTCVSETPGTTGMHACAARVAALTMVGPVALTVLVVLFRKQVVGGVKRLAPWLPAESDILVAPLLATLFFLLSWSGIHASTGWQTGVLPQKMFPAVVGLFTFASRWYGPAVDRRFSGYFDIRDRIPGAIRLLVTIAIPVAVSILLTNQERVSDTALKEQAVVLLGLLLAYLLMVPRGGDIVAGVQRMVPRKATSGAAG